MNSFHFCAINCKQISNLINKKIKFFKKNKNKSTAAQLKI